MTNGTNEIDAIAPVAGGFAMNSEIEDPPFSAKSIYAKKGRLHTYIIPNKDTIILNGLKLITLFSSLFILLIIKLLINSFSDIFKKIILTLYIKLMT